MDAGIWTRSALLMTALTWVLCGCAVIEPGGAFRVGSFEIRPVSSEAVSEESAAVSEESADHLSEASSAPAVTPLVGDEGSSQSWLAADAWGPNLRYDAAADRLSAGFRPVSNAAWEFRPVGRPERIDWEEVRQRATSGTGVAKDHAVLLVAGRTRSRHWLDAVRRIARGERETATSVLDKIPYQSQLSRSNDSRREVSAVSVETRAAAIEVWGQVLAASGASESEWGELAELLIPSLPSVLRCEVVRAVGRGVAPTRLRVVASAIESDRFESLSVEMRRAIVDGCLHFAVAHPNGHEQLSHDRLIAMRYDPDADVRKRIGRLAAVMAIDEAVEVLEAQTRDVSPGVRDWAFESLGILGREAAIGRLEEALGDSSERVRAAAVAGLAAANPTGVFGDRDESAVVRQAAAMCLADRPHEKASQVAYRLVSDPDRVVQAEVLKAIVEWPDALAISTLTRAMVLSSTTVRRDALEQLRERTGIRERFAVEASEADRLAAVRQWQHTYRLPGRPVLSPERRSVNADLSWAFIELDIDAESAMAWAALKGLTEADVPQLEELLLARRRDNKPTDWPKLWSDVLPSVREDFAALADLRSRDVTTRKRGARRLSAFANERSPSPFVLGELSPVLVNEQNAQVWRDVMRAVAVSSTSATDPLVPLALNSQWSDVRVLACQFVEQQARPELASWLRPLLNDGDAAVRIAAIRAAGACQHPALLDGPDGGLRGLMTAPSRDVRMEAATAMARLGDSSGLQELLRLAHSEDVHTRRDAASRLSIAANRSAIDPIFALAWTERDPKTRDTYLEVLDRLHPNATDWPADTDAKRKLELWSAKLRAGL